MPIPLSYEQTIFDESDNCPDCDSSDTTIIDPMDNIRKCNYCLFEFEKGLGVAR